MLVERLHFYRSKTNELPKHILFYRDGVSESQYGEVREKELSQVVTACKKAKKGNEVIPRITLVIVAKRHHARFYPSDAQDGMNPKSGLVIDEDVVYPKQFNFYLQAHDSPIGTARNVHYVVLENESGYSADELQEIVSLPSLKIIPHWININSFKNRPTRFASWAPEPRRAFQSVLLLDMQIFCAIVFDAT